ncbi:MAG: outer membrane protein assembly factor BamB family protein [Planctomycetota bacterium]|jgi:outer membrane protein assembly factor BamB
MLKTMLRAILPGLLCLCASALGGAPTQGGWRTDWSGRYPEAKPVLTWSAQENVIWKTKTKTWGNATPVVVGDKVFFSVEKMTLACASLTNGKILWEKSVAYDDVLTPQDRAGAAEAAKKVAEINKQKAPLNKEMRTVGQQLRKDRKNAQLKAKLAELRKKLGELDKQLRPYAKYKIPPTHKVNGYSSPTPTTDGTNVYVLYGPGIAACYDLAGNRKWMTVVERPQHNWGHSASPIVVDGTLVVHVVNVYGLDAATGKQRWKAESKANWGCPVPVKIGGVGAVVTTNGEIIRASDGKVMVKGLFKASFNGPVLHEGVVYAMDMGNAVAVRLPAAAGDAIKPETVWKSKIKGDRYYASPLVHDGLIYGITRGNVLTVLDVKDGKKVYERTVKELGKGTTYPSLVLAGKHVLVSSDNGTTLVLEPGREFKIAKTNKLEPFRATPVFVGDRMLVRTLKGLCCIGK